MAYPQAYETTDPHPQLDYELVCLEHLVPENHLLRSVEKYIDFSFIPDLVRPYYSETTGQPSIDPIVFFKMLLLGYLYNIRSERELERAVNDSLAFRWFLRIGLSGKAPDHSVFSWNRKNRFKDKTVFQEIFDNIVQQAIRHRLAGGAYPSRTPLTSKPIQATIGIRNQKWPTPLKSIFKRWRRP